MPACSLRQSLGTLATPSDVIAGNAARHRGASITCVDARARRCPPPWVRRADGLRHRIAADAGPGRVREVRVARVRVTRATAGRDADVGRRDGWCRIEIQIERRSAGFVARPQAARPGGRGRSRRWVHQAEVQRQRGFVALPSGSVTRARVRQGCRTGGAPRMVGAELQTDRRGAREVERGVCRAALRQRDPREGEAWMPNGRRGRLAQNCKQIGEVPERPKGLPC